MRGARHGVVREPRVDPMYRLSQVSLTMASGGGQKWTKLIPTQPTILKVTMQMHDILQQDPEIWRLLICVEDYETTFRERSAVSGSNFPVWDQTLPRVCKRSEFIKRQYRNLKGTITS